MGDDMDLPMFTRWLFKESMSLAQIEMANAIQRGGKPIIGYDLGRPGGDKTCEIYGHECDGKIIIDEVITK